VRQTKVTVRNVFREEDASFTSSLWRLALAAGLLRVSAKIQHAMAHNTNTVTDVPRPAADPSDATRAERREFVRKAAMIGLPVIFASVGNRTVWVHAQTTGPGTILVSATLS
jgi:hypothetical protein